MPEPLFLLDSRTSDKSIISLLSCAIAKTFFFQMFFAGQEIFKELQFTDEKLYFNSSSIAADLINAQLWGGLFTFLWQRYGASAQVVVFGCGCFDGAWEFGSFGGHIEIGNMKVRVSDSTTILR